MKSKFLLFAALALCTGGPSVSAQCYTLEECKNMALENNRKLMNSRLDADIARQTRREAFTNYFPAVSATGMAFNANRPMATLGMEVPVLGALSAPMFKNGKAAGITAVQPVFAGGRIVNGNKLARLGEEVSRFQLKLTEDEVLTTTEEYFWRVVSLQEKLRTIAVVEQQLERIRSDVEVAVTAGVATRNDLLRVELQQQETRSNRLTVGNGIRIAKLLLRQYAGIPEASFDVRHDEFAAPQSPVRFYVDPAEAVTRRTEYRLLDKNVEAGKLQKRLTLGKNLPSVGVGAGYMYHDLTGRNTDFGMVFASVSIPISSWWGGSHALKRDKMKLQQAEIDRLEAVEMMEVEIARCWNELQEAYQQILLSVKSIDSATENLRLNGDCYRAGTAPLSDLLDAQTLLQQSRNQHTDACTAYQVKLSRYMQATGR